MLHVITVCNLNLCTRLFYLQYISFEKLLYCYTQCQRGWFMWTFVTEGYSYSFTKTYVSKVLIKILSNTIVCYFKKHILHGHSELLRIASSCCILMSFKLYSCVHFVTCILKISFWKPNLITEQWLAYFGSKEEGLLKATSLKIVTKNIVGACMYIIKD